MIISDLEHLEVVAEASSVVGGAGGKKQKQQPKQIVIRVQVPQPVLLPAKQINQANVANIKQIAKSESAAVAEHGDADSSAKSVNNLKLDQANVAG